MYGYIRQQAKGGDKIEIIIQNQKSISREIYDGECFVNIFIN
jgi:hypothetical protein